MKRQLLLVILIIFVSGCGYSLANRSSSQLHGRSLYVGMFANSTYQPNLEGQLRLAVMNELVAGPGQLVPENLADLVLSGEIESLAIETAAYSSQDKANFYRLILILQARLVDKKSGRVIWKTKETFRDEYPATADLALQRNARDAAIAAICKSSAIRLVRQLNQSF